MIYLTGNMRPTPRQRRIVRQIADDSFTRQVPADFGPIPCASDSWVPDLSSMVALRMKCVDPHTDDWVGEGNKPRRYIAVFWVIQMPGISELILQVGSAAQRMYVGDFIAFDDSVMHSVHAKQYWRGVAYQMRCA
jgi:hypothetical protein